MSSLRLWVILLALVAFLAGFAGGLLSGDRVARPQTARPFAAYEALLAERFDLSSRQTDNLRFLMDRYHQDVESLEARYVDELEPELIELGRTCRERIVKYVLPEERVAEFERLAGGLPPAERSGEG